MLTGLLLLFSLGLILFGAELFTNGIEWLGRKLHLEQGAVGSILAALGTALPETSIPVIAILSGDSTQAESIGVGAILGAPFLLATLGFLVVGLAAMFIPLHNRRRSAIHVEPRVFIRDLSFFLVVYTVAIVASLIHSYQAKTVVAIGLVGAYLFFVYKAVSETSGGYREVGLSRLYLARNSSQPNLFAVLVQVIVALALIIVGAHNLVGAIGNLATQLAVPAFVLSVIIIPIATELPETFNSVIWIRQAKDTLAVGNITGAMVFQSTLVPALGIALTPWKLDTLALTTASLAIVAAAFVLGTYMLGKVLRPHILVLAATFYMGVPLTIGAQMTNTPTFYLWGIPVIMLLIFTSLGYYKKTV